MNAKNESSPAGQVLTPASTTEVVDVVRNAVATGEKLRVRSLGPAGNGTATGVHGVDLKQMNSLVDYPARDMTITVQAGMAVSELNRILAAENQQLPIDVYRPEMSLGALVAGDVAGSRQYGYGTLRDYLIGIEAVDGQGRVFHAGGRVVKNVAGYDLCRLMVGSRGLLGILTQLTFKLKPIPEHSVLCCFRFDDASAFEKALDRLNVSAANPVLLDFLFASSDSAQNRTGDPQRNDVPYSLTIGVEGTQSACRWQLEQLRNDCVGADEVDFDGHGDRSVEHYSCSADYGWHDNDVRIRTVPSKLAAVAAELAQRGYSTQGHGGNGILFAGDEPGDGNVRRVCDEIVAAHGGHVSEWDVDHPASAADPLSTRLRAAFDPHSVFVS